MTKCIGKKRGLAVLVVGFFLKTWFPMLIWMISFASPSLALQTSVPKPTFTATATAVKISPVVPKPARKKTPTLTPTLTVTNSPTALFTFTNTDTPTITSTYTVTPTATATLTPTHSPTPGVFHFLVSPKPDSEGRIHFKWGSNIPSEEVFIKVYSSGFRIVFTFQFDQKQQPEYLEAGLREITWDGKDDQKRKMPPGKYLCFIDVKAGGKHYEASGKTEIP